MDSKGTKATGLVNEHVIVAGSDRSSAAPWPAASFPICSRAVAAARAVNTPQPGEEFM